ncbi:unnamed protein product [Penicillium nalgiovense]|nr:unnamed protein product [Penicillium nalgiovense]
MNMPSILVITTTFTSLAASFVTVRLWTRLKLIRAPGWDDLLIFAALFLWLAIPFYNLTLILTKFSALVFLCRTFRSHHFLLFTHFFVGFLTTCTLWIVPSAFIFCIPIDAFWNLSVEVRHARCLPIDVVWYLNGSIHIITDLAILFLPMPMLYPLKLSWRRKAGVMLVFAGGICVIAASSARLYEVSEMLGTTDYTKTSTLAFIWSSIEANVSIICACLPPLTPLLSRLYSYFFLPRPLHTSPASKPRTTGTAITATPNNMTHLCPSRKQSIGGGTFCDDFNRTQLGSYAVSITAEAETKNEETAGGGDLAGKIQLWSLLRTGFVSSGML